MENVVVTVVAPEEIRNKAKQKLEQELKESNNKEFAEPIINYLQKRIQQSDGAIRDDVVYEWAEDYYHKDDKEEVEKELKESKGKEKKIEPIQKEELKPNDLGSEKPNKEAKKDSKPAGTGKKKNENIDGQLDMFSLLGI